MIITLLNILLDMTFEISMVFLLLGHMYSRLWHNIISINQKICAFKENLSFGE